MKLTGHGVRPVIDTDTSQRTRPISLRFGSQKYVLDRAAAVGLAAELVAAVDELDAAGWQPWRPHEGGTA